jgi:succinate dehydrogenase flavin-adding protein (antitoxin of CptAB toxin-antitoxin module)
MPSDPLLSSFVAASQGGLQQRLAELYDSLLNEPDEDAAQRLRDELDRILLERIDATRKSQA